MKKNRSSNTQYWATAPASEIASEIKNKVDNYHKWLTESGTADRIQRMYDAYYSYSNGGMGLVKSASGVDCRVNHLKSILERMHSLTVQSKVTYSCKSINSDSSSMLTADLGNSLLAYYGEQKGCDAVMSSLVELGLIAADSYVYAPWDFKRGEKLTPTHNTGEQTFSVLTRFDVISSTTKLEKEWYVIREKMNRFELAQQYPHASEDILKTSGSNTENHYLKTPTSESDIDEEEVEIFTLLHKPSLVLPKGRLTIICGDTLLDDVAFPYRVMPVASFAPGRLQGSVVGDSPAYMLLSLQEAVNALYKAVVTNNMAYSRQNLYAPSAVSIENLSEGLNLVISAQKPEPLQLVASSPETYKLIESLQQQMQILSGMGSAARSNPEASLKSGTSLALMLSIAISHLDSVQKAYVKSASELAGIIISNLQQFCQDEILIEIGGKSRKSQVKKFTGNDIKGITRVQVELSSALQQSPAGRMELATQLLQIGAIKDPVKLLDFIHTGQSESLSQEQFKDSVLIRSENEMIMRGESPTCMSVDQHVEHLMEHKALANDTAVRQSPEIMKILSQHILDHLESYKTIDPDLAAILGLQPLPSQQMALNAPPGDPNIPGNDPSQLPLPPNGPGEMPVEQRLPSLPNGTPPQFQPGA